LKRLVYLISPNKIYKKFYKDLENVLAFKNVKYFQLRIKKMPKFKILEISKKIKIITKKHNVKLIINDNSKITKEANADGCHIGQQDGSLIYARKYLKNKIIGATCHNSKRLAKVKVVKLEQGHVWKQILKNQKLIQKAEIAIGMDIDGTDGDQEIGRCQNVRIFVPKIRIVIDLHLVRQMCMADRDWGVEHQRHIIPGIVQLQLIDINRMVGDGGVRVISGAAKYMIRRVSRPRKICNTLVIFKIVAIIGG